MKRIQSMVIWVVGTLVTASSGPLLVHDVVAQECLVIDGHRNTHLYVGKSAADDQPNGHFHEFQGLANGEPEQGHPYWYYSRNINEDLDGHVTYIYRVPYTEYLGDDEDIFDFDRVDIWMPDGAGNSCGHVGDIDYYTHWVDAYIHPSYLAAAYDNCANGKARIGFFDPNLLDRGGSADPRCVLDVSEFQDRHCPWVSVRNDGRIFSSWGGNQPDPEHAYWISEFTIDWEDVRMGRDPEYTWRRITLLNLEGDFLYLGERQGADFSSDGKYFIMSARLASGGHRRLYIFEVGHISSTKWRLVRESSITEYPFKFERFTSLIDEAEGISYFDLSCIPNLHREYDPTSELHVMRLHNYDPLSDRLTIHHYTSLIPVDPDIGIGPTYYDRWQGKGAWDGSNLVLEPVIHTEEMRLSGRDVRIIAPNGEAIIRAPEQ